MKHFLFTLCVLFSLTSAMAQEESTSSDTSAAQSFILQALSDVQCPAALIMTNNGNVNVRQQPNTKARKMGSISGNVPYAVLEEQSGWYKVLFYAYDDNGDNVLKKGWVSGTVTHKTVNKPITGDMQNAVYGLSDPSLDDGGFNDFSGCVFRVYIRPDGVCVAWVSCDGALYLGRYINNVCCMKYRVPCEFKLYYDEESINSMIPLIEQGDKATGLWIGKKKSEWTDETKTIFTYGSNYAIKLKETESLDQYDLDLSIFDINELLQIFFSDKIKKNETTPFYINSVLLSGDYVNNH